MLTQIEQRLCDAAISARHNAYAPYSKFKVGAAILDEFDNIHLGVNVEMLPILKEAAQRLAQYQR